VTSSLESLIISIPPVHNSPGRVEGYYKLNQVLTSSTAAIADVLLLPEEINTPHTRPAVHLPCPGS
jgi:hypothetical protein